MNTLNVKLGERSYPIYIDTQILGKADLIAKHIPCNQVLVVTNDTIAPLYLEKTLESLKDFDCDSLILPDGEQYKTIETSQLIFDKLLTKRYNRTATLIALGGGVIGDITGFAAACYQRGIHFIQIPTTLLAQVDSSVGGKTGVNHPLGKNMIGAFHQPRCVIADTDTLNTLDDRQLSAGIAEVIKYGLISDYEFFVWLENNIESILTRDTEALAYAIERSCQNKADVVAADEREGGKRALLNLGHTFGHAIETGTGYGTWLHGEAVASGMLMAANLSASHGWMDTDDVTRIENLLIKSNLPTFAPEEVSTDQFMQHMSVDKKVLAGKLRFVLMKGIGKAFVTEDIQHELLINMLNNVPKSNSRVLSE